MNKKIFALILTVMFLGVFTPQFAWSAQKQAQPQKSAREGTSIETTAESAVLMEPFSGKILYEKEPHKRLAMASVTKLMTLLLAVEAVEQGKFKLDDKVVASENAWEMGGSQIYLEPGEEMSLWDLLLSIGLQSANDASVAVAEYISGSEELFVQAMNDKAASLGLTNTHFVNCHGLTADDHYTSAYDLAVILKEGLKSPLFKNISAMKEYDLRGGKFKLWNTNKLLWWYEGTDAGKTGWTEEAKYCLASSADRDGLRLICVVLGTVETRSHFRESTKLFDFGFARYKAVNMAEQGAVIASVKVGKGQSDSVEVLTESKVSIVVPRGEDKDFEPKVELPALIDAPVQKGQKLGSYVVTKNNIEVLRVGLIAKNDVPRLSMLRQMKKVIDSVY